MGSRGGVRVKLHRIFQAQGHRWVLCLSQGLPAMQLVKYPKVRPSPPGFTQGLGEGCQPWCALKQPGDTNAASLSPVQSRLLRVCRYEEKEGRVTLKSLVPVELLAPSCSRRGQSGSCTDRQTDTHYIVKQQEVRRQKKRQGRVIKHNGNAAYTKTYAHRTTLCRAVNPDLVLSFLEDKCLRGKNQPIPPRKPRHSGSQGWTRPPLRA